jgi:hypothetical protein
LADKVVVETNERVADATDLASLPALRSIKAFMLPPGFPTTVTADYLPYVLWSFPTHVTGWLYRSLTTASLLEGAFSIHIARFPGASRPALTRCPDAGVGVSTSGHATSVVAATAAIRWITKDGLGVRCVPSLSSVFGTARRVSPLSLSPSYCHARRWVGWWWAGASLT